MITWFSYIFCLLDDVEMYAYQTENKWSAIRCLLERIAVFPRSLECFGISYPK